MTEPRTWLLGWLGSALLPGSTSGRRLSAVALVDALGTGMYYTGSALYFTDIVGLSTKVVGTGLAVGGVTGLVLTVPVGVLADRLGAGRVLIALQLWRAACYVAFCLTSSAAQFVVVAAFIGIADSATPPNHQAVVAAMVPQAERVDTLAKVRAVRNIGFGMGALVAAVAIAGGSRAGYLVLVAGNALSFLVTAALLQRVGAGRVRRTTSTEPPTGDRHDGRVPPRYLAATVLNGVLSVHMTVLALGLPLWVAGHTTVPVVVVGPLVAGNTVLAVLLQARLARPAANLTGALRSAVRAGLGLAACGAAFQVAGRIRAPAAACAVVTFAVVVLTLAELWQSAAGWTISYELAPARFRGRYLATFQLGTSLQAISGPLVITALVLPSSIGWLAFGAVALCCGLAMPHAAVRTTPAARHRRERAGRRARPPGRHRLDPATAAPTRAQIYAFAPHSSARSAYPMPSSHSPDRCKDSRTV
jgi:MFS family permease